MTWILLSQCTAVVSAVSLVIRLLSLRLHGTYLVFLVFFAYDAVQSIMEFVEIGMHNPIDDRILWMTMRVPAWVLSLWMVHSLLSAILRKLPGISRLSRMLFDSIFLGATLLALLTAVPDYLSHGSPEADSINRALAIALALERAISIAAILVLLMMLVFILWFPVQMPRNLAAFSVGLVIYFGAKTALLLMLTYLPHFYSDYRDQISTAISFVLAACFSYWTVFINKRGEAQEVRLGHSWKAAEQGRLIGQLEAINAALLGSRR